VIYAGTLNLLQAGGWTLLTAVNLMLFSLIHKSVQHDTVDDLQRDRFPALDGAGGADPLAMGLAVTFFVPQGWRLIAGGG